MSQSSLANDSVNLAYITPPHGIGGSFWVGEHSYVLEGGAPREDVETHTLPALPVPYASLPFDSEL